MTGNRRYPPPPPPARGPGGGGELPPDYFTLATLLIFMHAVQVAAIAVYIMFGPPKNGIASYAYAGVQPWLATDYSKIIWCTWLK